MEAYIDRMTPIHGFDLIEGDDLLVIAECIGDMRIGGY